MFFKKIFIYLFDAMWPNPYIDIEQRMKPPRIQYTIYAPSLFKGGTGLKAASEAERVSKIRNAFGDHTIHCFLSGSQEEAEYKMNLMLGIEP